MDCELVDEILRVLVMPFNLSLIQNMRHRKLCLGQIFTENFEDIAGYFKKISVKIWREQDLFKEFGCFRYKFHQITSEYPDMPSVIW